MGCRCLQRENEFSTVAIYCNSVVIIFKSALFTTLKRFEGHCLNIVTGLLVENEFLLSWIENKCVIMS